MKQLNLPKYSFRITGKEGSEMILDTLRKKYVKLTPEEWVRQNFVQYLIQEGRYPPGLIGIEMRFSFNKMKKRVDILVHDRQGNPVMIVECKSPEINISDFYEDKVYDQIGSYNLGYKVPYVVVTNGLVNYAFRFSSEKNQYEHMLEIPFYEDLIALKS
ncbi:MAG TPA: restriction endonuclease subunit R [Bacteroidales bacterium]|nr:restriction endonuclease subunit R [Bacteroidales bacterium]HBZ20784.1 restriction endonuclease subunit R [Bacteroidales bacterium]